MSSFLSAFPGIHFCEGRVLGRRSYRRLEKADTKQSFASFFRRRRSPLVPGRDYSCNVPPGKPGGKVLPVAGRSWIDGSETTL